MKKTTKERKAEIARALAALRKTYGGGRPKVLRKCPGCGVKLGARDMRIHKCAADPIRK
jgi:hypothetical protein